MTMKEQLNNELKEAMRNKDTTRRDSIRLLLTVTKNAEIEKGGELTDAETMALFQKQAKQRRESIEAYEKGGRPELAEGERRELEIIEGYLPQQMGEEEIRQVVRDEIARVGVTSANDIGKIMGPLMGKLRGQADGSLVQRIAREELSA
jgi:uncharacterized protein